MNESNSEKDQAILTAALQKVEFEGLSKDEKKALTAYDNIIQQGLAVFNGEALKPTTKVAGDSIENAIAELIEEDQKELLKEFKDGFRQILRDKIALDKVILIKQKEFNKAVVAEKKVFTQKAGKVLGLVDNIHKLRADYMNALTVKTELQEVKKETDKPTNDSGSED